MNLKEAAMFRQWSSYLCNDQGDLLFPWMPRVDVERLAQWLSERDTSVAWICDFEDLKRRCL
jgi:hypothetical protein